MASTDQWQVAVGDKRSGPFSFEQLAQMISQGRVPRTALVWKDGMSDWRRWPQLPEFADLVDLAGPAPSDVSFGTMFVDVLVFRRMIVPFIIQVVFWACVLACFLLGLVRIGYGFRENELDSVLIGFAAILVGPLGVRIWCEFIIVAFRISETLTDIKNQLKQAPSKS